MTSRIADREGSKFWARRSTFHRVDLKKSQVWKKRSLQIDLVVSLSNLRVFHINRANPDQSQTKFSPLTSSLHEIPFVGAVFPSLFHFSRFQTFCLILADWDPTFPVAVLLSRARWAKYAIAVHLQKIHSGSVCHILHVNLIVNWLEVRGTHFITRTTDSMVVGCLEACPNSLSVTFEPMSKLTRIEAGLFFGCEILESICIYAAVEIIGASCFLLCNGALSPTF
jgi:hypothetical protein